MKHELMFGMESDGTETMKGKKMSEEFNVEQWLAIRKQAGLEIDPATAEVFWEHGLCVDPYGIYPDLADEYFCVGRQYFARAPGSDIWVHFSDLPEETHEALQKRRKSTLALPAGPIQPPWADDDWDTGAPF